MLTENTVPMINEAQLAKSVSNEFAQIVIDLLQPQRAVCVSTSKFYVFSELLNSNILKVDCLSNIPTDQVFDSIWGDLPLAMERKSVENSPVEKRLKFPGNWVLTFDLLQFLSNSGIGLFLVEPHGFSTPLGIEFQALINEAGYYINAIFDAPVKLLHPESGLTPVIVAISKTETDEVFVGELHTVEQATQVAANFVNSKDAGTIEYGTFIDRHAFNGFTQLRALMQIERLETQYNLFEKHVLRDVADEINAIERNGEYKELPNSIYIPRGGNSKVIAKLDDTTRKPHNYFQVVLNEHAVSEYVALFFQSAIGRLVLESLSTSSLTPRISKRDIEKAMIALPDISQQNDIVDTHKRLDQLKRAIEEFDQEISINPTGTKQIQQQLDSMLQSINSLSEADRIRGMVREGESKKREFKETLSLDLRKKTKEKYIETSCLKTISAFLNSEGGTLLVGVADNGSIPGVNVEINKFHKDSVDNYLKHIKNLLKARIGEQFYPYFDGRIVDVDEKKVLEFECRPSDDPCYLDNADFYVRTNPATDKLEGPKLVEYVKHHFLK